MLLLLLVPWKGHMHKRWSSAVQVWSRRYQLHVGVYRCTWCDSIIMLLYIVIHACTSMCLHIENTEKGTVMNFTISCTCVQYTVHVRHLCTCTCSCLSVSTTLQCTGFENRERAYRNYPEALLHWKVSLEVVRMRPHSTVSAHVHWFNVNILQGLLICENYSKPLHDPSILPLSPSTNSEHSQKFEDTQKQGVSTST